jgi:ABC-type bacteriocin/lantibiotic exporter with double-glycine peptidase domain
MLYTVASTRLRGAVVATAALSATAKLLSVVFAMRVAEGDVRGATIVGVVIGALFAALRVVGSGARVNAECDLHLALARALLDGDVLAEPTSQPLRSLPEPTFYARGLITDTIPELAASAVAAVVVAPILASRFSAHALAVSAIAVTVVMVALLALSRVSGALQARVMRAQQDVGDRVGFVTEGRLELVARGAEEAAVRSLQSSIDRYRGVARRGGWTAALLGRAPLVAGLGAVLVVVLLDSSYREAVTSAVLAQALVLAACIPILLGVVLRANDLTRAFATIAPLVEVLGAPRRPELAHAGSAPPALPATIAAAGVTFAYAASAAPTLRGVSFVWKPGTVLIVDGPNGSGKSTLLRLLLGLRSPQEGSFTVGGTSLRDLDLRALR